jgi:hypothetical protein
MQGLLRVGQHICFTEAAHKPTAILDLRFITVSSA